jgi:hypothetical protein
MAVAHENADLQKETSKAVSQIHLSFFQLICSSILLQQGLVTTTQISMNAERKTTWSSCPLDTASLQKKSFPPFISSILFPPFPLFHTHR